MMQDNEDVGKENEDEEDDDLDTDLELEEDSGDEPALERNLGTQPIEEVMTRLKLKNHDVMQMNRGGLTHKMVQKARKGRRLKPLIKVRITEALNAVLKQRGVKEQFGVKQLFNY